MPSDLVMCADATASVGAGHVMRCLSLAEAWLELGIGGAKLYGTVDIDFVQRRVRDAGVEMVDTLDVNGCSALVVDSYDPETRGRMSRMNSAGLRILVDDLGVDEAIDFDIVWNPNPYGSAALYPSFSGLIIAGCDAVPLRNSALQWRAAASGDCLVTLGSGVVGEVLRRAFEELSRSCRDIRFQGAGEWIPAGWKRVSPESLWTNAASCRFLITAAGSSVWQAASIGSPMVVVKTADNQELVARWVSRHQVPVVNALGCADPDALGRELLRACRRPATLPKLSNGARRVALAIQQTIRT